MTVAPDGSLLVTDDGSKSLEDQLRRQAVGQTTVPAQHPRATRRAACLYSDFVFTALRARSSLRPIGKRCPPFSSG